LPSSSQILQPFSLSAENQSLRTNSPDSFLAQGDSSKQIICDKKSVTKSSDVPDQEKLVHPEENSREMPKASNILQMDSKTFQIASNDNKSYQVPEMSNASNLINPRRKISVYCRSFDVVAVEDSCEDQKSNLLTVRQSTSNFAVQTDEKIDQTAVNKNDSLNYQFNHTYRSTKNDSDSSNGSSPQKHSHDSLLEDESLIEQEVPRKVHLAPTRLKLSQEVKNELDRTVDCAFSAVGREKIDDASVQLSSMSIDNYDMLNSVFGTESHSANKDRAQEQSIPLHLIPHDQSGNLDLIMFLSDRTI